MGRGRLSEAATYWIDRKVVGVVVEAERLELHVVAHYPHGFPLAELTRRLRERLEPVAEGRTIDIVVDDALLSQEGEG